MHDGAPSVAGLSTVAYRVHAMPQMVAFYTDAFGVQFRETKTGGFTSQFGILGDHTLKFVPIRDGVDFEGFPVHQLGFEVRDVQAVIDVAVRHGGRIENEPVEVNGRLHAAIRDPDGNTVELYGPL